MRRINLGIWRNIGKIVILVFQIVYEEVKWHVHSFKRVKRISPKSERSSLNENIKEVKSIYLYRDENEMVELSEQPFYDIKPE